MDPASKIVLGTFAAASTLAFTVSDAVLTQLIVNGSAVAIALVGAWFAYLAKVNSQKAKEVAEDNSKNTSKVLTIVNGHSGNTLQIASKALRRVANMAKSGGLESWKEDDAIATESERLYTEHMAQAKLEAERQEQKDAEDRAVQAGKL